jgi:hypothetical protein
MSTSSSTKEGSVTVYNGNNYNAWRMDIRSELLGKEVWDACVTNNVVNTKALDVEATNTAYAEAKSTYLTECKGYKAEMDDYCAAKAEYNTAIAVAASKAAVKMEIGMIKPLPEKPTPPDKPERSDCAVYVDTEYTITVFDTEDSSEPKSIVAMQSKMCKAYNILMKSLKPQFKTAV